MPSEDGILISAGGEHEGPARELCSTLSARGLNVRTAEGGRLPTEPVDVLVCFADGKGSLGGCLGALEEDLARAVVLVSSAPPEEGTSDDTPILRADPAWGTEALAALAEAALALAREREGRARAESRLGDLAEAQESFAGIVSHDLRTPVTTLRLLEDLFRSQFGAKADIMTKNERVSTDELLDIMSRSLDTMAAFTEDMLEAWRLSPGVPEKAPEPVGLNGVVEDIVAGFFPVAMQKDIVLDLVTDPEVKYVLAERRRVGQVVSNLVGNALKFTPSGGTVTVSTRHASGEEGEGGAVLQVTDTGPGIAEEDRGKMFRRFSRGKARATAYEPSTGLGLYICKEIVEIYGGRIWFESDPGKGSRFFVFFPGVAASVKS